VILAAAARPLVLAHRGSRRRAPENTLPAFELALDEGADGIEFDVRLSADGVPILLHDPTLDRTTSGRGHVAAQTLDALRRLDAGTWLGASHRGARIPTLGEALDFCQDRAVLNIELKIDSGRGLAARRRAIAEAPRLAQAVARDLSRARRRPPSLLISSFEVRALEAARAVLPVAALGWLRSRTMQGLAKTHRRLHLRAVNPHLRLSTPRRLASAKKLALEIFVYPVNDPADLLRLASSGVTAVITDDPLIAIDTLKHRTP